ncbi:aminodeoxychorismate/anthranilate synthase component II [Alteromonas ponticola]|uniref:Aminodeoxychorismate/anthranilate synthase component II n=1 Tax=Alteromonas aquimaris TaxID=2998417 RepID=A0ABT3PAD4_9ALTE|nr:aminodeoxychorismate/anthranilate synthase component II [Alteromonas aquimaris]MCW8109751.1 aminodeoxychorismate/anthranilate synthase component II [Alteromonas aquimaris]
MLLLIDNFDSFTHNLARYFVELDIEVKVVRNNELTLAQIEALQPSHLVISPGPCTPNEAGISLSAIEYFAGRLPILGVCLGHQAIGQVFGAKVVRAREILHGKVSAIHHHSHGIMRNLPTPFNATRYHSLVLQPESMPATLRVDAWSECKDATHEIMAISHASLPVWGVQFHPESLLTEHGHSLLSNFLRLAGSRLCSA